MGIDLSKWQKKRPEDLSPTDAVVKEYVAECSKKPETITDKDKFQKAYNAAAKLVRSMDAITSNAKYKDNKDLLKLCASYSKTAKDYFSALESTRSDRLKAFEKSCGLFTNDMDEMLAQYKSLRGKLDAISAKMLKLVKQVSQEFDPAGDVNAQSDLVLKLDKQVMTLQADAGDLNDENYKMIPVENKFQDSFDSRCSPKSFSFESNDKSCEKAYSAAEKAMQRVVEERDRFEAVFKAVKQNGMNIRNTLKQREEEIAVVATKRKRTLNEEFLSHLNRELKSLEEHVPDLGRRSETLFDDLVRLRGRFNPANAGDLKSLKDLTAEQIRLDKEVKTVNGHYKSSKLISKALNLNVAPGEFDRKVFEGWYDAVASLKRLKKSLGLTAQQVTESFDYVTALWGAIPKR